MSKRTKIENALIKRIREQLEDYVVNLKKEPNIAMQLIQNNISSFDNEEIQLTYQYAKYLNYLVKKNNSVENAWSRFLTKLSNSEIEASENEITRNDQELGKKLLEKRREDSDKYDKLTELLKDSIEQIEEDPNLWIKDYPEEKNIIEENIKIELDDTTEDFELDNNEEQKTIIDQLNEERESFGDIDIFDPVIEEADFFGDVDDEDYTLSFDEKEDVFGEEFGIKTELNNTTENEITSNDEETNEVIEEQKETSTIDLILEEQNEIDDIFDLSKNNNNALFEIKQKQNEIIELLNRKPSNLDHDHIIDNQIKIKQLLEENNCLEILDNQLIMKNKINNLETLILQLTENITELKKQINSNMLTKQVNEIENVLPEESIKKIIGDKVESTEKIVYTVEPEVMIEKHIVKKYEDSEIAEDKNQEINSSNKLIGDLIEDVVDVTYTPDPTVEIHEYNLESYSKKENNNGQFSNDENIEISISDNDLINKINNSLNEIEEAENEESNPYQAKGINDIELGEIVIHKGEKYIIIGAEEKENNNWTTSIILKLEHMDNEDIIYVDSKDVDEDK